LLPHGWQGQGTDWEACIVTAQTAFPSVLWPCHPCGKLFKEATVSLLYEDRTQILIGGFFAVHNGVGLGRHEEAYHRAFKLWCAEHEVPMVSKPPVPLLLRGLEAYVLFPDIVAWDEITVELKALPRKLGPAEELQLFDYLRARPCRLGLLVNMGLDRVHVERRIYDPPETTIVEDWSYWSRDISGRDREIGTAIRNALRMVYDAHHTGYGREVVEEKFGGMLNAFRYGAPPHGGSAPGVDRIVMLLAGVDNIREVIVFPFNQQAQDLMMNAPGEVTAKQLRELHIRVAEQKK